MKLGVLCFLVVCLPLAATDIIVSPSDMAGWEWNATNGGSGATTGTGQMVPGPASPPAGTGSAEFQTGSNGDGAIRLRTSNHTGTKLSNVHQLGYSTYVQSASYSGLNIYLQLYVDYNNDNSLDDVLFFEPEYQNGYTGIVPTQADSTTGIWQTWDALNGGWWSTFDTLGTGGAGANVLPLSSFITANPDARIVDYLGGGGLRLTAGFGAPTWDNFVGNADALTIQVGTNQATTYDFDPGGQVPEPGTYALVGSALAGLTWLKRRKT